MADEPDVYHRLRKHLDALPIPFPETASGVEIRILKRLFTPEERPRKQFGIQAAQAAFS